MTDKNLSSKLIRHFKSFFLIAIIFSIPFVKNVQAAEEGGGAGNTTSDKIQLSAGDPGVPNQFSSLQDLTVPSIISGAIGLIILVVALVFFFILIMGGLKWVTSGGDEKKVAAARSQITNALIGLVIVFGAWAIMSLIGNVFGVTILGNLSIPTFQ